MVSEQILERYLEALLKGDRNGSRSVIEETLQRGIPANQVYMDIVWPIMTEIDNLYREDRISPAQEAFATRINRTIIDQLQNKLPRRGIRNRKIAICTALSENGELGGQMLADLFESDGWEVRFLGGSLNNEDILSFVHGYHPDILLIYGMNGQSAPGVRSLIDTIRSVNAWPDMKIMLSGGVFGRAEGLWEEIGADLYADTAIEAVRVASSDNTPVPERTINRRKRQQENMVEEEDQNQDDVVLAGS